jgi:hypothetical protein
MKWPTNLSSTLPISPWKKAYFIHRKNEKRIICRDSISTKLKTRYLGTLAINYARNKVTGIYRQYNLALNIILAEFLFILNNQIGLFYEQFFSSFTTHFTPCVYFAMKSILFNNRSSFIELTCTRFPQRSATQFTDAT